MGAALALGERGRGRTAPNPCVGCVIVQPAPAEAGGKVVGRGWTQPSGRPHAEAMALTQAGDAARGATAYVTLEPCAAPGRGPACAGALIRAGIARVVAAIGDSFPAVNGAGFRALEAAGVAVTIGPGAAAAERGMAGFLMRQRAGRPHVTLKLALSLDGAVAMGDGASRWITGAEARAHGHLERSRHEAILVGRGTWETDAPKLDVRLAGLEARSPRAVVLSNRHAGLVPASTVGQDRQDDGSGRRWTPEQVRGDVEWIRSPADITHLPAVDHLLIEGGAGAAAAFLAADLVDRLLLYRAPIMIGAGRTLCDIGLVSLAEAHGRWSLTDARQLGSDRLEVYERTRCSPA